MTFLSSNAVVISLVSSIRASDVDIFVLHPYWLLHRRLYLLMKESNLIPNNFSRIFENCGNRDTGLYLVIYCFPFALYNGITFAIFLSFGNIPDVSDILHIYS